MKMYYIQSNILHLYLLYNIIKSEIDEKSQKLQVSSKPAII